MSIFDRLSKIIDSGFDWIVGEGSREELPQESLDGKIRNLEAAVEEGGECVGRYGAAVQRMKAEREEHAGRRDKLRQDARSALEQGDDERARGILKEKVRADRELARIEYGLDKSRRSWERLRDRHARLRKQLGQARMKRDELRLRKLDAGARLDAGRYPAETSAGSAFDKLEREVDVSEAEVRLDRELREGRLSRHDVDEWTSELEVEDELEDLRRELGNPDQG